jgi:phosphoribosylamine--glycine ligase
MMKVLIVGEGGREHALAATVARSPRVSEVLVAPGNPGTAAEPRVRNVPVGVLDIEGLLAVAAAEGVALTIVGPDAAVAAGVRDAFDAAGRACLAPTQAAGQLESSKSFAKAFMARHGIPTARHEVFEDLAAAQACVRARGAPIVVKADGLAAGKGVVVAQTVDEALAALEDMFGGAFGQAGHRVVIEDFLQGEEASFIVLADGVHAVPFASSQDHKRIFDGDLGPNTGGMGAYSPAPVVTPAVHARVMAEVILPTLRGMAAEGMPYQGFLYAGLMIDATGAPSVIEFNCRFGDPEAQPVLSRLRSDLVDACEAALRGELDARALDFDPRVAIGVVLAAEGYPGSVKKGAVIDGLDAVATLPDVKVFHAGTTRGQDGVLRTSGGRVVCVVALGEDIADARAHAYAAIDRVRWDGMQFRHDIGHRALAR